MIPIIVIEGATATGKTALALELAQRFDTEIISADSRQVYKYLDIGTAKPAKEELKLVKHHLINIIKPDETFNAGLFRKKASALIRKLHKQDKIPIVCGGSGLYVKALLEGLFNADVDNVEIRNILKNDLQEKGLPALYEELTQIDKTTAEKLSSNDRQRILRALEVFRATGMPISEHWQMQQKKAEYLPFKILLEVDRNTLYQRLDARVISMINSGLSAEIRSVLKRGYSWEHPGFNSVGYKEFKPFIEEGSDLAGCTALAQQHTRNYAKRQLTWYRKWNFSLSVSFDSINISSVEKAIKSFFAISN